MTVYASKERTPKGNIEKSMALLLFRQDIQKANNLFKKNIFPRTHHPRKALEQVTGFNTF